MEQILFPCEQYLMRKYFIIFTMSLFCTPAVVAQTDTAGAETYGLREFVFFSDMKRYHLLKRKAVKMYPYVKYAADVLADLDTALLVMERKREKNRLIRSVNRQLNEDFRYVVLNMTELEGEVLVKLLHRNTGKTAYDIISGYQSPVKAMMWQGISLLGGANLKHEFHLEEDRMLADIVKRIESGEYPILQEPILLNKEQYKDLRRVKKENSKRIKALFKDMKKEAKEKEKGK